MTDEEMAEEYVKSNNPEWELEGELECHRNNRDVKQAYLAGFEAGRPKWHKVADGDLPKSLMSVVNQDGEKVIYNDYCKSWRYDDADEYICATPIVWCEIPEYTEE